MRSSFVAVADATQCDVSPARKHDSFSTAIKTATLLFLLMVLGCPGWAQVVFPTSRGNATRAGANTSETMLTPGNVSKGSFGHLFSAPVDYQVLAQPLYVPQVNIAGQGLHDVVFVVTQADSVYAFDASNGEQLWHASMTNGGVPASLAAGNLPCGLGQGFTQEGIVGTPVIDPSTNTMYLVAKSVINGKVTHYLHALDITTGNEQASMGSPVQIVASSVSKAGHKTTFNSLHQKNRPGLLLLNGVVYLGFGSNGCNDSNSGWVLAYSASNVQQQLGVFNTSPDRGLTSIWQAGSGLAGDEAGNVFFSTAESGNYDVASGGQSYSNSILKLTPPPWTPQNAPNQPADFFTPWSVGFLNTNDLDVSSGGPVILPDQSPGPAACSRNPCHEVVAAGKEAVVYVLDRDNMGHYFSNDSQILQEYELTSNGDLDETPAYWNGLLYFAPPASPVQVVRVSNGLLVPFAQSPQRLAAGTHSPIISANGNSAGILWLISGNALQAYDAISLHLLYATSQIPTRDKLPPLAHFAAQTVADGKVFVATQNSLEAYGLFRTLTVASGNNQSAHVLAALPVPLQILADDPYTGQPLSGATVNFSDGGEGGTFSPSSAVTGTSGIVSTTYTFPKTAGTYTLTASATNFGDVVATAIALPLAPKQLVSSSGTKQTGAAGSVLPHPIVTQARDVYGNPVPGVTVSFSATAKGIVSPTSAVTDANGRAGTVLQLPTTAGTVKVKASSTGAGSMTFPEYAVAGPAASVTVSGGNNQAAPAGTVLPQALSVAVTDQYGNPVSGVAVTFSDAGAGGSFSNPNPQLTPSTGSVAQVYTLPGSRRVVTITATVPGVSNAATFTETAQ
jgi:Bacterial Ig-like domain (group 1)